MVVSSVTPRMCLMRVADRVEEEGLLFAARVGQQRGVRLGAGPEVQQQRGVAAVIKDHVREAAVRPLEDAVGEVPVFFERLALVGEHRRALDGDGGGGMVLRREDVAGSPADLSAERLQRLDQHGCLDGHVQRPGDAGAAQRLRRGELVTDPQEARHLRLGDADLFAAPVGKGKVGDMEVARGGAGHGRLRYLRKMNGRRCASCRAASLASHRCCSAPRVTRPGRLCGRSGHLRSKIVVETRLVQRRVFAPASAASAAALSVRSQVKSGCLRPKWP